MEINRLFDLIEKYKSEQPNKAHVFGYKINGNWKKISVKDYIEKVNFLSIGMLSIGIKPGDRVATITNNRPEWNFVDMALMQIGAIQVPIYPTISENNYRFIFEDAEIKYAFISNEEIFRKLINIIGDLTIDPEIYSFDEVSGAEGWQVILNKGIENINNFDLELCKSKINEEDIVSIIYTSGTTGNPKGAMLSHKNILSNVKAVAPISKLNLNHVALSFLPLCHIYERMLNYMYQFIGMTIYYAENIDTIAENLQEIKPNIFCAVPRVLEKFYDKIIEKGRNLGWLQRFIFFKAINFAKNYEPNKSLSFWFKTKLFFYRFLIFSKWQKALGGNINIIVSGSASLQENIAKVFLAAGFDILEGYGLTETSPVIAVSTREKDGICIGTVGKILPGVSVKLADDGEILCKGPNVMKGYFKRSELTNEVIDNEGWLHTGDIGTFVNGCYLKITDRKKEIFKTSGGKYIAPQKLESKIKESQFIDNVMVIGENKNFAAALIIPSFKFLNAWCKKKKIPLDTPEVMVKNQLIIDRIFKEIQIANLHFDKTEQIKKIELLPDEWSVAGGELSPTLKLRRKYILEKYQYLIDRIYLRESL